MLFEKLLGITRANHTILKTALPVAAATAEVESGRPSAHGTKFEMRIMVTGPAGSRRVVAVWLIEKNQTEARLITCYVESPMLKEHDTVALVQDRPAEDLRKGGVGAIVHCHADQDAYEVEFVDERGRTKAVATVSGREVMRLNLLYLSA